MIPQQKELPKIVCAGANQETLAVLEKLIQNNVLISGLITLPEKTEIKGSDYVNMISFADENNIPLVLTDDINSCDTKNTLRDLKPDYIFILLHNK